MTLNDRLALTNACLTAAALPCLVLGYRAVRAGDIRRHRAWMLAASGLSFVFLVLFAARFYLFGMTAPRVKGAALALFYAIYFTHEPLAVVNVALAGAALALALRGFDDLHREVARVALPIWLYAAVTGLAIYAFLYLP